MRARQAEKRRLRKLQPPAPPEPPPPPKALVEYEPSVPDVTTAASRELLPRILSDEIAWRSELLDTIRSAERALLHAIRKELYDSSKQTLPQIATALCKVVELSERIVERTRKLDLTGANTSQVAGLFAKHAVLLKALKERGLVDDMGRLKAPAGSEEERAGEAIEEATLPDDDASVSDGADAAALPPEAEGVL